MGGSNAMADSPNAGRQHTVPTLQIAGAVLLPSIMAGVAVGCSAGLPNGITVAATVASTMTAVVGLWKSDRSRDQ